MPQTPPNDKASNLGSQKERKPKDLQEMVLGSIDGAEKGPWPLVDESPTSQLPST